MTIVDTVNKQHSNQIDQQVNDILLILDGTKSNPYISTDITGKDILASFKSFFKKIMTYRVSVIKEKKVFAIFPAIVGVFFARLFPIITLIALGTLLYKSFSIVLDRNKQ